MDLPKKGPALVKKKKDYTSLEETIVDQLLLQSEFHYLLPRELYHNIYHSMRSNGIKSVKSTARIINTLILINRSLHRFFSNSTMCLFIIKQLSERFDLANDVIATAIKTKAMRERLQLQNRFHDICLKKTKYTTLPKLKKLCKFPIDFNFTYSLEYPGGSCSTILSKLLSCSRDQLSIADYLLSNGADLHMQSTSHISAYTYVFSHCPAFIPFLVQHKKLEPNRKNYYGETPLTLLMHNLYALHFSLESRPTNNRKCIRKGIKILLKAGADPHISNNKGHKPIDLAYHTYDKEIKLLNNAMITEKMPHT